MFDERRDQCYSLDTNQDTVKKQQKYMINIFHTNILFSVNILVAGVKLKLKVKKHLYHLLKIL